MKRRFWNTIELARQQSGHNIDLAYDLLAQSLEELSLPELLSWTKVLENCYTQAQSSSLYENYVQSGGGEVQQGFRAFCGWLILQGKKCYQSALSGSSRDWVEALTGDPDCECEELFALPFQIYSNTYGSGDWNFSHYRREFNMLLQQ